MKTQPIRAEKDCLNCGTEVSERYCTHCGQENTIPHESFGHLFNHFFADVIHYDSKTLLTLKYLLFKPGFLTREYIAGKRVRYVNPIKFYIFTSFVFFFFYFMLGSNHKDEGPVVVTAEGYHLGDINRTDSISDAFVKQLGKYKDEEAYKAAQKALPADQQDGVLKRKAIHAYFRELKAKEHGEEGINEHFKHNYPKMMFVLLPLFALFLKWLYSRRRKWFYADHAIFSLHFHTFFFIFYLFTAILDWLFHTDWIAQAGLIIVFIYLVLSLKNIYGGKSFWKAFSLTVMYGLTLLVVFTAFTVLITFLT